MTTPQLDRIITVTGSNTVTEAGFTPYRYDETGFAYAGDTGYPADGNNIDGGSWTAGSDTVPLATAPTMPAALQGITRLGVSELVDSQLQVGVPITGLLDSGLVALVTARGIPHNDLDLD